VTAKSQSVYATPNPHHLAVAVEQTVSRYDGDIGEAISDLARPGCVDRRHIRPAADPLQEKWLRATSSAGIG
jgi:hypothetical protein